MSASRHHNALEPGYRLHWYRIESVLGQGGFGITYLATDTNLDQPVAIKEFLPSDLAVRTRDSAVHPVSEQRRETFGWGLNRFLAEARTLAQFRHPNIVRVYSVFEANGTAYMVMEYERGTSLEDALKFRKLAGERALIGLTHALMDGLELVHAAGFIHRDIKPDNIYMRANDGVPVLLDFGSARQAVGVETRTLTSLVTPGYAPFEQYNATREHDRQGPWTDIYSLAATLYRGVTGRGPIDAVARADALLRGEPDPLLTLAQREPAGFSPQLVAAVDHGLAFQPADRPQSLAEWRAELPPRPTTPDFSAAAVTAPVPDSSDADAPTVVRADVASAQDAATRVRSEDVPAAPATRDTAASAGRRVRRALLVTGLLTLLVAAGFLGWSMREQPPAPHGAQVSRELRPQTPAADPAGDAPRPASVPAPRQAPAQAPPVTTAQEASDAIAAERERVAEDRRALLAERERRALESEQRAAAQARRVDEARERLAEERRQLEVLREREAAPAIQDEPAPARAEPSDAAQVSPAAPAAAPPQAGADDEPAREHTRRLLAAAQEDLDALRLTSPAGANAVERYRAVLAVEPDNQAAAAGLVRVVERYLELVEDALRAGDLARADTMLERARRVGPADAAVSAAADRVARARRQADEQAAAQQAAQREATQQAARRAAEEAAQRRAAEQQRAAEAKAARQREAEAARQREAEAEAARRVTLGIFPNAFSHSCYFPVGERIAEAARAEAAAHARVSLGYSYYAPGADTSTLGQGYDVWQGSAVRQEPNVPKVRAAAGSLGVDAVLMGWYQCSDSQYADENSYVLELFVVDLHTGEVQRTKSPTLDTARAVRELLAALYTARGL